jgi:hypothetical protein
MIRLISLMLLPEKASTTLCHRLLSFAGVKSRAIAALPLLTLLLIIAR